jgi:hypothetical protein
VFVCVCVCVCVCLIVCDLQRATTGGLSPTWAVALQKKKLILDMRNA